MRYDIYVYVVQQLRIMRVTKFKFDYADRNYSNISTLSNLIHGNKRKSVFKYENNTDYFSNRTWSRITLS